MSINKYENGVLIRLDGQTLVDAYPTQGSTRPASSGGVYSALEGKLDKTGGTVSGDITADKFLFNGGGGLGYHYTYEIGTTLENAVTSTFNSLPVGNFLGDINVGGVEYFICGRKSHAQYASMFIGGYYGVRKFARLQEGNLTVVDM